MSLINESVFRRENAALPQGCVLETFRGQENPSLLKDIGALRLAVWRASNVVMTFPPEQESWLGPEDDEATHWAVFSNQRLVASTRLNVYSQFKDLPDWTWYAESEDKIPVPFAVIARLVVAPEFKGQRIGSFLDEECIALALQLKARCIICEVPEYRVKGLLRNGFEIVQPPKLGIKFPSVTWTTLLLNLEQVTNS